MKRLRTISERIAWASPVLVGLLFGQLIVAVLNPPEDKLGFIGVVVVVDVAAVALLTAVRGNGNTQRKQTQ
ncbi:MAG: hypothetical protein ACTHWA_12025 [Arachnia sp.]